MRINKLVKFINYCIPFLSLIFSIFFSALLMLGAKNFFFKFSDLPEFYTSARLFLESNQNSIYNLSSFFDSETYFFPLMNHRQLGFFLPPPAIILLLPMGMIDSKIIPLVHEVFLIISFALGAICLNQFFKLNFSKYSLILAFFILCGFVFEPIRIGQLSTFLFFILSLIILSLRKKWFFLAGLLINLFWLKPQLIIPICCYLFGNKKYKIIAGAFCGSFILFLIIVVKTSGIDIFQQYSNLIKYSIVYSQYMQPELNPTIRGQLLRLAPVYKSAIMQLASLIWLLFLFLFYKIGRSLSSKNLNIKNMLMVTTPLGILTSLHCYNYDLILLIPCFIITILDWRLYSKFEQLCIILFLVSFLLPVHALIYYSWVLKGQILNPYFFLLLIYSIICLKKYFPIKNETKI